MLVTVTCLLFLLINRFVKKVQCSLPDHIRPATTPPLPKKPKASDKQGIVSATIRAQEFGENFYESGSTLFCRPCNVVVDHCRKSDNFIMHLFRKKRHLTISLYFSINHK